MTITPAAAEVIGACTIDGTSVYLPPRQLDRKLYVEVDTALSRLGGKWNRKAKAHLFAADPADLIAEVRETGQMPEDADKVASFWRTPRPLAEEMVRWCGQGVSGFDGARWLEPSAGDGAIAEVVRDLFPEIKLTCIEYDAERAKTLAAKGFRVNQGHFQHFASIGLDLWKPYDAVVMNPPFTEREKPRAWVEHVTLAYGLLVRGGRLAAIVPSSIEHSSIRAIADLREWVTAAHGDWEMHPEGAFKESGTGVRTALLTVVKP